MTFHLRPFRGGCPIWMGANSPGVVRVAGGLGDAWSTDPTVPLQRLMELAPVHREARHADDEVILFTGVRGSGDGA